MSIFYENSITPELNASYVSGSSVWTPPTSHCSLVPINNGYMAQGVEWEYLKKPSSPTNSLIFSDYEYTPSSKSSSVSSYPPSPSSSPTFGRNTSPHKSNKSVTSESSCSGSVTCHSPLLEDCRNHIGSFEDLSEIKGHILEFSRDQHGSRFIQQHMEMATDDEKADIFSELEPHAVQLMSDLFGNYVIQKFFEFGNRQQVEILTGLLRGNVVNLSLQTYGCRVVQKAIENLPVEAQVSVVNELDGHVIECVMDQNGNHVIQKCFECVSPEWLEFIITAFEGKIVALAMHPYGCRVVQRALEHANSDQCRRLLDEVLRNTCILVEDQYGNYVMQHILEHGRPLDRTTIIKQLRGQMTVLSQHKYASNVIEKCISHSPTKCLRYQIIEELLLQENMLLVLLKDKYANYVMQKALDCADPSQNKSMVYMIRPHLAVLRKYTYAKHMVIKVEKILLRAGGSFW